MEFLPEITNYIDLKIDPIIDKINKLDLHQKECMDHHERNIKFQSRTDNDMAEINKILVDTLNTNKEILGIIKEYLPTLKRTQAVYTTQDTIKDAAVWIAALAAGSAGLHYLLKLMI